MFAAYLVFVRRLGKLLSAVCIEAYDVSYGEESKQLERLVCTCGEVQKEETNFYCEGKDD